MFAEEYCCSVQAILILLDNFYTELTTPSNKKAGTFLELEVVLNSQNIGAEGKHQC